MKIGLYIHIPFCHSKCYYCDFLSFPRQDMQAPYVEALIAELQAVGKKLGKVYTLQSVFIGGGTPTVLPPLLLDKICEAVEKYFQIEEDVEWTIEANPGTLSKEMTKVFHAHPINRVSMGLQTTDDQLLKKLGRIHTFKQWEESMCFLKEETDCDISTDLMFALPGQSFESFKKSVRCVGSYELSHLSLYALIIEADTPFGNLEAKGQLEKVSEQLDRQMYHWAKTYLKEQGYHQYEISNWAKPGKPSRHNSLYWRREPYIGVGLGAHSLFQETRYHNVTNLDTYLALKGDLNSLRVDIEPLTLEMAREEFMFLGLRMTEGISLSEFKALFGQDLWNVYPSQLKKWIDYKVLVQNRDRLFLSDYGMDICNVVFSSFL
ncbi:coproporphyrinogen III oxidase [Sporanaerobium hydrogeniformans]|uniref:Coproporphyrinogen III oxidase n=1 Tax=Sporanaerobium hydrogeniformans TaxID=3072179 RepID=A0AC61DF44_9FIRM|nr:radical SAM family heme chaperone HemW [Sporanaerobium hydrogeniformans]PHV71510.1 coproporphyrinogen III oxidase [Sporanaerobium hydrogeniformans]